jgi:2-polyprenyl-3-methyl-5-hydroxy-6-metoxy-1,4-benzoquinol methylase
VFPPGANVGCSVDFENVSKGRYAVAMHDVAWTPEKIERFWNYYSQNSALSDTYFAAQVGRHLIDFVASKIRIGTALDFGCGRGDLIGHLLKKTEACGIDQSAESVAMVNHRFQHHPRFRGAFVEASMPPVDTVFALEVVEHMDDVALGDLLANVQRLLKPGGHLVVTTPNNENLSAAKRICPDCGCVFHQMQHVRSWTSSTLEAYLVRFGFRGTATPMLLSDKNGLKRAVHLALHRLRGTRPNLVFIGQLS